MNIKKKINEYIEAWENRCYKDGLPDSVPDEIFDRAPSYKRIVLAILRNDNTLKTLGFSQPKSALYSELKRVEIENRKKNE